MSVRCNKGKAGNCEKFEIKYCCPATSDNDEVLEKAERPFPRFDYEVDGKCSSNAVQYHDADFSAIKGYFVI